MVTPIFCWDTKSTQAKFCFLRIFLNRLKISLETRVSRDAQNVCAFTIVGTVLNLGEEYTHYTYCYINTLFLCFRFFVQAPFPQELGGTLKGFIVKYREQESAVSDFTEVSLPATARQYTLENLKIFTLYGIMVAAVNEKGPGPYTPVYNVTTGERRKLIARFAVMCLVTWPWIESEAGGDFDLIRTSLLFICRSCSSCAN